MGSEKFLEERVKREAERVARFKDIGNKFNNLFLQFRSFHDDGVSYACSLLSTSSRARVYGIFFEKPWFFTFDQLVAKAHYSPQTVRKAIKRLEWFGVIVLLEEDPETWGLVLKNGDDYR